jgi:hypothetical protein
MGSGQFAFKGGTAESKSVLEPALVQEQARVGDTLTQFRPRKPISDWTLTTPASGDGFSYSKLSFLIAAVERNEATTSIISFLVHQNFVVGTRKKFLPDH